MAWSSSDRASRLPADWSRRRARVMQRDGYRCTHIRWDTETRCTEAGTEVDHIIPNDDHSLDNLQLLCSYHHMIKTQGEAQRARRRELARRPKRKRPDEDHPSAL